MGAINILIRDADACFYFQERNMIMLNHIAVSIWGVGKRGFMNYTHYIQDDNMANIELFILFSSKMIRQVNVN